MDAVMRLIAGVESAHFMQVLFRERSCHNALHFGLGQSVRSFFLSRWCLPCVTIYGLIVRGDGVRVAYWVM